MYANTNGGEMGLRNVVVHCTTEVYLHNRGVLAPQHSKSTLLLLWVHSVLSTGHFVQFSTL